MKFAVEGMTCGHCIHAITQTIRQLAPNARVAVDLAAKTVRVDGGPDPAFAAAAIEAAGYAVMAAEVEEHCSDATRTVASCCGSCHA